MVKKVLLIHLKIDRQLKAVDKKANYRLDALLHQR